jgi:hypothetical protein
MFRAVPEERVPAELLAWRPLPAPTPQPRTIDYAALRPRVPCRVMMAIDVVPANTAARRPF